MEGEQIDLLVNRKRELTGRISDNFMDVSCKKEGFFK